MDYAKIKKELDSCKKPLFLFHDDTDGLCSFLQFYKYKKEGHWSIVKSRPKIDNRFLPKVQEYDPDKIFVLDIAEIEQEFVDKAKRPVIWVDHHEGAELDGVICINPKLEDPKNNIPASGLCYNVLRHEPISEQLQWIALAGCVGDWYLPEWAKEFGEKHPSLIDSKTTKPEIALFESNMGKLSKIIQFLTKGSIKDVRRNVAALMKIKHPLEILDQMTDDGKFIMRRFNKINQEYDELWKELDNAKSKDKILLFTYSENKTSFSGELATEAIYRNPDKVIIICREKSGEMRCSLRTSKKPLLPMIKKALIGINGYGGGHEYACGAGIKKEDFKRFVENIREQLD